jgi:hypothetical protein
MEQLVKDTLVRRPGLGGKLSRFNSRPTQLREELAGLLSRSSDDVVLHRRGSL